MFVENVEDYKKAKSEIDRELNTWSKVSWGIFLGSVLMAIMLGQWSATGRYGAEFPLMGSRISGIVALFLLGTYHWRKRVLEKQLNKAWNVYLSALPESERTVARKSAHSG